MKLDLKKGEHIPARAAALLTAGCLLAAAISGCGALRRPEKYSAADTAMGTVFTQTIYADSDYAGKEAAGEVMAYVRSLEADMISWRLDTSEIFRVNAGAGDPEGTEVSPELERLLEQVLEVAADSKGALDVTIGEVTGLWDIDGWAAGEREGNFTPPDRALLEEAVSRAGYEKVTLRDGRVYLPEGTGLDLGAVGKGAVCSGIGTLLSAREEVTGAVISAGGNILTYGAKPDGSPWEIGVADPRKEGSYLGFLTLDGEWCVSTTGDYERYVIADGVRYHHVMDPRTGYPARSGVVSATVLSRDGLLGDALSTACFVLGAEEGCALAEEYGAEALLVDEEGALVMTDGMKALFHLS